ncbi:MAG: CPBP family intramembrane metalloprotease [Clostridiaceae bacterium]|jgi:membrane protease YdiL (CAAX protease family)|nr:CPBP family intramembrane metalloprotease [Clostridiaceae bacterium]
MDKQSYIGKIYFFAVLSVIVVRVLSGAGVFAQFSLSSSQVFSLLVQCVCMGLIPLVLYMVRTPRARGTSPNLRRAFKTTLRDFGYIGKVAQANWGRTLCIAVLMIFTAKFISFIWSNALVSIGYTPATSSPTEYLNIGDLFLAIFMTAVLPAVFEELTHRGLLFAGFRNNGIGVVFVTAALFALIHNNIRQTGYTFYDGVILGLLVYYTRSIYPAMLVHFLNNFSSVLGDYAGQNGGVYAYVNMFYNLLLNTLVGRIIYAVLFVLALYFMFELFRGMRRDNKKYKCFSVLDVKIYSVEDYDFGALLKAAPYASFPAVRAKKLNVFLAAAVFLSAGATLFSFIWGILR